MYAVSEEYLTAIKEHFVVTDWHGQIKTVNGVIYNINPSIIVEGSGKITRQICTGEDIEIGTTCASELDLSLYLENIERYTLYKAQITLYFQLLTPNGWEDVPLGIFTISEPPERSQDVVSIHAYDNMLKFNETFGTTLVGSPYKLLEYACNVCNVGLGTTQEEIENYVNGEVNTYNFEELEIYTWRDFIGYLAIYLCCYAYIGVDGLLYLKPYSMEADRTIDADWRYDYKPKDYEAYYTSLSAYFAVTKEYEQVVLSDNGLDYDIGTNPLIQFNADDVRKGVLTNIITKLAEVSYTPFTASIPCDPSLMPGDVLNFTGNHAVDGKLSAITKQVININGSMEIECVGTDPNLNVMTATEKRITNAARNSDRDAILYYDYANANEFTIADGHTAQIILFEYTTTKETHVDFHGEIKALVETTESYDEGTDTYTENDGVLYFTYRQGGDEVTEYYPVDSHFDGIKLIHLLHTWWASGNILSTFEVYVRCEGCSLTIDMGSSRGYIAGIGLVGDNAWDGAVRIYEDFKPIDFGFIHKAFTDEASVTPIEPNRGGIVQPVTKMNFFNILNMKSFIESIGQANLHKFTPVYNDGDVEKDNVVRNGNVWQLSDTEIDGSLTTYNCEVPRILKVTSRSTANSGSVSYLVSFDNGLTWYTYSSGFVRWTSGAGMLASILPAITESEWAAFMGGTNMLKMRVLLTGNATLTDIEIYLDEAITWTSIGVDDVESYEARDVKIEDGTIQLITSGYIFEGEAVAIDSGNADGVTVDPTGFSAIQAIKVSDKWDGILTDDQCNLNTWVSGLSGWQRTIRYENGVNEVSMLCINGWEDFELTVEVEPDSEYELTFDFNTPTGYRSGNVEHRRAYVWNSTWIYTNAANSLTDNHLLGYSEPWETDASDTPTAYTVSFASGGNSIIKIQFGLGDVTDNVWTTMVWRNIKLIKVR